MNKKLVFLILLLLLPQYPIRGKVLEKIEFEDHYLSEDERVRLTISPKNFDGGEIIVNVTNKMNNVNVNCMIGFDKDVFQPRDILLYVNKTEYRNHYFEIDESYLDEDRYNITFESKDNGIFYNGELTLWDQIWNNETQRNDWVADTHKFDWLNRNSLILYRAEPYHVTWKSIKQSWNKIDAYYDGLEHWFISDDFTLVKNRKYTVKIVGDLKILWNVSSIERQGAFGVTFKPSSLSLGDAITQKKLYYIEPSWYSASWQYRKEIIFENNTRAGTNEMPLIRISENSGTDDLDGYDWINAILYIDDSKIQDDFDDVRWTEDDGTTLLYQYCWDEYVNDYADYVIRLTDDLSSDVTVYFYYGNSGASQRSDGVNTLAFYNTGSLSGMTKVEGDDTWDDSSGYVDTIHGDNTRDTGRWTLAYTITEGFHQEYSVYLDQYYSSTWRRSRYTLDDDSTFGTATGDGDRVYDEVQGRESATEVNVMIDVFDNNVQSTHVESGDVDSWFDRYEWVDFLTWFDEDNIYNLTATDGGSSVTIANTSESCDITSDYLFFSVRRDEVWIDNIRIRKFLDDYEIQSVGNETEDILIDVGDITRFFGAGFNDTSNPYANIRWNSDHLNSTFFEVERNGTFLNTTTYQNYTDYNVSNGQFWRYRVRNCFNNSGDWTNSSWSSYYNYERVFYVGGNGSAQVQTVENEDYFIIGLVVGLIALGFIMFGSRK